jgi:hypothetical protein
MTENLKAKAEALKANVVHEDAVYLKRIHEDMSIIRQQLSKVINYMVDAESEVPEKMRRFIMYMHDMHDVKNLYDEHGITCPPWVLREVERCDDRLRQLLTELHTDGGAFDKVRREMSGDKNNRYDHNLLLSQLPGDKA